MLTDIRNAAKAVGITTVFTNSQEKIETQLNRIVREEELPVMLISWDINITIDFDSSGFIVPPKADIVALLLTKPEDLSKVEALDSTEEMYNLFTVFIKKLYETVSKYRKEEVVPITSVSVKLVPTHGMGKHSGVLAKWKMLTDPNLNCGS